MQSKIKVSLGIAAYNAEKNIETLLRALFEQEENESFYISDIVIHCDNCTDKTVEVARNFESQKVRVIDNRVRKGFAGSLKTLLSECDGDVVGLFNDDIKIQDSQLVIKLLQPFLSIGKVGMVCGNPQPLSPTNFVEKANSSGFQWWYQMRLSLPNGGDGLSVDGKIIFLSRDFIKVLTFPENLAQAGNVDSYIYFFTQKTNFKYVWVRSAVVWYRNPNNFKEHFSWAIRNQTWRFLMPKHFGIQGAKKDKGYPKSLYLKYLFKEFFKNPLGMLLILGGTHYVVYKAKQRAKNFNPTWDVIETSKNLDDTK